MNLHNLFLFYMHTHIKNEAHLPFLIVSPRILAGLLLLEAFSRSMMRGWRCRRSVAAHCEQPRFISYKSIYAVGMRSQTRQNSFISGGVPKETRT
jgi:hypothetical protein